LSIPHELKNANLFRCLDVFNVNKQTMFFPSIKFLVAISRTFEVASCFGLNKIGEGQRGDRRRRRRKRRRRRRRRRTVIVQMIQGDGDINNKRRGYDYTEIHSNGS
jgi:hypothetical protein